MRKATDIILSSQLFDGVVNQRTSAYVASLVRSVLPGQTILLASGERCRVVGKTASASGIRLRLAKREGTFTAAGLAALHPVSQAGMRLASFVHAVLAADSSLNTYVNAAIEQAGLPKDPGMNWDKWLGKVFNEELQAYTDNREAIDDTIRDVVCHELFEKRILETVFNPDHPSLKGKDLAHKVSAFLAYNFKQDVPVAVKMLRRAKGIGMRGKDGLKPALSLTPDLQGDDARPVNEDVSLRLMQESGEDDRLALDEVHGLLDAFREWYRSREGKRPNTIAALDFITERVEQGIPRAEIRAEALGAESPLVGRDGNPYSSDTWKKTMQSWARAMTSYAESRSNPYANTGTAKAIINRAKEMGRAASASGLHMAMEDPGQLPTGSRPDVAV
jgi:hypothetical protein